MKLSSEELKERGLRMAILEGFRIDGEKDFK